MIASVEYSLTLWNRLNDPWWDSWPPGAHRARKRDKTFTAKAWRRSMTHTHTHTLPQLMSAQKWAGAVCSPSRRMQPPLQQWSAQASCLISTKHTRPGARLQSRAEQSRAVSMWVSTCPSIWATRTSPGLRLSDVAFFVLYFGAVTLLI